MPSRPDGSSTAHQVSPSGACRVFRDGDDDGIRFLLTAWPAVWVRAGKGDGLAMDSAGHIVLLGDSVFDNAAYVAGGPDVVAQLRARLPAGWKATLMAVDGSVMSGVARQLETLPAGATHLVVSVGGNDALGHVGLLEATARSVAEALNKLADAGESFERAYRAMLNNVLSRRLPTAVSTIYYPRFPDAALQRLAVSALAHFNDPITRAAFAAGVPLLDLRLICDRDADYANPIEPSARGGEKIAAATARLVAEHDFASRRTEVFVS